MEALNATDDSEKPEQTIEYGDQFRHIITQDVKTVNSVREESEKVCWVSGGWDYKDELIAAINDEQSLYEVEARGDDKYEGAGY